MKKESFIIYSSFYRPVEILSDEQLGRLFRAICLYQLGEQVEVADDIVTAYRFFVNQFELDNAKYAQRVEAKSRAGRCGGAPRGNSNARKKLPEPEQPSSGTAESPEASVSDGDVSADAAPADGAADEGKSEDVAHEPTYSDEQRDRYKTFMTWMSKGAPNVYKACGRQTTIGEYVTLREAMSFDDMIDMILALENRTDLLGRYRSLFLTLRSWMRREKAAERNSKSRQRRQ